MIDLTFFNILEHKCVKSEMMLNGKMNFTQI